MLLLPLDCYNSSTGFKLRPALATLGGILSEQALYLVRRDFYLSEVNYFPKELFVRMAHSGIVYGKCTQHSYIYLLHLKFLCC